MMLLITSVFLNILSMVIVIGIANYHCPWEKIVLWELCAQLLATHNTRTTISELSGLCPGQPRWDGTRRYILPSSGLSGAKWRLHSQTHQQSRWTATPSRLIGAPSLSPPPFLCQMPFLAQPSQFILAWDRHQICWLAYSVQGINWIKLYWV